MTTKVSVGNTFQCVIAALLLIFDNGCSNSIAPPNALGEAKRQSHHAGALASSYEDCVLEHLTASQSQEVTRAILVACNKKFPAKDDGARSYVDLGSGAVGVYSGERLVKVIPTGKAENR